jgi:hypothetical protein
MTASADDLPPLNGNPMLEAFEHWSIDPRSSSQARADAVQRYAFATPTDEAVQAIKQAATSGVVELGAGTGYWARLLHDAGVDVMAFDLHPPPFLKNEFFPAATPWFPVMPGDERAVARFPNRLLLLVWPTQDETWPATALRVFHGAGGDQVAVVGEGSGGRMGDLTFHAMLGEQPRCLQCHYGALTSQCTCEIEPQWQLTRRVPLPHWAPWEDDLFLYKRRVHTRESLLRRWSRRLVSSGGPAARLGDI